MSPHFVLQKCLKIIPYVGVAILGLILLFSLYVRSLPVVEPPARKAPPKVATTDNLSPDGEVVETKKTHVVGDELPEQLEEDLIKDDDGMDGEM